LRRGERLQAVRLSFRLINLADIEAVTQPSDGQPQAVTIMPDAEVLLLAGACAMLAGCGGGKNGRRRGMWVQTDDKTSTIRSRAPQHRPPDDQLKRRPSIRRHVQ